jgi:hypothetical protein
MRKFLHDSYRLRFSFKPFLDFSSFRLRFKKRLRFPFSRRSSGKVDGWAENYYLTKCGNIITYMYYSHFHKSQLFW